MRRGELRLFLRPVDPRLRNPPQQFFAQTVFLFPHPFVRRRIPGSDCFSQCNNPECVLCAGTEIALLSAAKLNRPDRVYFICGDSDPGPFVSTPRSITGTLSQIVLEDWILGAIERGAHYIDAPTPVKIKNATLWLSPATMLNLETVSTVESWKDQTEQEEDGAVSGITDDYATLPITTYRRKLAQILYDAQRTMGSSDIHIALSHEPPTDEFIYTSEDHDPSSGRFLSSPELILAGHYCGGVWRLPVVGAFYVPDRTLNRGGWFPAQERVSGQSIVGETQVYITRGVSTNGDVPLMPFRLFNQPEISVLTLTSTLPENMLEAG